MLSDNNIDDLEIIYNDLVLILVLMEYALWLKMKPLEILNYLS